ncbi:hypothetical protein B0J17DRAFT_716270 [Rhizoctonia solani]|nr:hypothetical protein B0J17DRAFT_716270 [Rhizoctonia solani]
MGEFPEAAIRGTTVEESASTLTTSVSPSQPIQATDPSSSVDSSSRVEIKTSVTPSPAPATSKVTTTSFSHASSTSRLSTTTNSSPPVQTTTAPALTTSIQPSLLTQQTSTSVPPSTSIQVITPVSISIPISTTFQESSTPISTITGTSTDLQTSSFTEIVTRPIITPTYTPPPLATIVPTAHSRLSFGAIVGVVSAVVIVLVVTGICIVLGPKRALRKVGIRTNRDEEKIDYEEWERTHRESGTWTRRPASIGANSDWWKPPPGPFSTRPSTLSMGGPGMAGVGAGRGMDRNTPSPISRGMSQRRVEERGAVRSGWFATSMVRGASLLSLGSLVRSPAEPSHGRGSERMSRMGTGGTAGKRFQELYRRERASGTSASIKSDKPTEYLATVSEMGERKPSEVGQHRAPVEMGVYRSRSTTPKVRRPSRLAMSYVPEIVVHNATLPNLSSVSSVTHESGRGYDADAEVDRRPHVF